MPDVDTVKGKQKGPSGKLAIDLASIPKELQDRAPKTNGEKHFDRTIAVGLFFAIYAASVAGAIVIKKQPWGNQRVYTPLKNAFRRITNYFYEGKYAADAEKLVGDGIKDEATSQSVKSLLDQVRKVLGDVEIAHGTKTIRSSAEFLERFEKEEGFLKQLEATLSKEYGINLAGDGLEAVVKADGAVIEKVKALAGQIDEAVAAGSISAQDIARLKNAIKDYKLDKQTEDLSEIVSLSMGGTAVVLPYKLYDDRRHKAIIQEHNDKYGTGIDDPLLDAAARARIVNTATQSWPSALMTRFAALGVLVGTAYTPVLGPGIIGVQKKWGAQLMELAPAKKFMNWIGDRGLAWYPYKPAEEGLRAASEASKTFTGEMIAADATWTMYTTALMLAFGKVFAPIFGNKTASKSGAYTPYQEPQPAAAPGQHIVHEHHYHQPETPMAIKDAPSTRIQHPQREAVLAHAAEHAAGV